MGKPIKSRHGLTRCRTCRAHIQAAATPSATACPFCGANLHGSHGARALISLPSGRGGILAASLLAFSAAGCGGGQTQSDGADDHVSSDNTNQPPSDDAQDRYAPDPADDNAAIAEYGVSPDAFDDDAADDPRPSPRYGLPPSRR